MKWLLLGYGDLSEKRVAAALQQAKGSELTAIWGRDTDKCKAFADRHNIDKYFAGTDGLDSALKENIDAVYVCTPVDTHLEYTMQALEAGNHVLCEKPMAIDVAQCQKMINCAQKNNLELGIAYYRRCFPYLVYIKNLIEQERLGKIIYVEMKFQEYYCPSKDDQQYWRVLPERAGGGVSYDVGSHRLDILNYWFGNVANIKTHAVNLVHNYPAEDTAAFLMELSDFNNAPAVLTVSWASKHKADSLFISGSEMSVTAENLSGPDIKLSNAKGTKTETFNMHKNVHTPVIENFVTAVRSNTNPICDGPEGMKTNVLLESIRK